MSIIFSRHRSYVRAELIIHSTTPMQFSHPSNPYRAHATNPTPLPRTKSPKNLTFSFIDSDTQSFILATFQIPPTPAHSTTHLPSPPPKSSQRPAAAPAPYSSSPGLRNIANENNGHGISTSPARKLNRRATVSNPEVARRRAQSGTLPPRSSLRKGRTNERLRRASLPHAYWDRMLTCKFPISDGGHGQRACVSSREDRRIGRSAKAREDERRFP